MNEIQKYYEELEKARKKKLIAGEKQYGNSWEKKDMIDEALAEIIDAENYLFFLYVKLRRLQKKLKIKGEVKLS